MAHDVGQQHPLSVYFWVWGLLFVLSSFSYMVDFYQVQGIMRWSLIIIFMLLKAGLIMAVFMHMKWERLALVYVILIPPLAIAVFVGIMAFESTDTLDARELYFVKPDPVVTTVHH